MHSPAPTTGNYMPPRPDLSFARLDESVFKFVVRKTTTSVPETNTSISKTSKDIVEKPKSVRPTVATKSEQVPVNAAKQNSLRAAASISTGRPVNTVAPKSKVNDALPKTYSYFKAHPPVNNVTTDGPKAVVSAAVGNGENAIIKRLMVDLLPLEEVIKEVKLLEKKNSVLFTETECLVLSLDFKLLDESQVLLKVPRQNNMYSFDLKNVVPSGGSGPDWLFDIDLLTNSMKYELVTAGNQTNRNAGIKDNSSKDVVADDAGKKTNEEPANKGERNGQQKEGGASNNEEGYANSTNRVSTVSLSVSAAGQSFNEGVEADLNNLETTLNVSPIPTTRIHKDYLKDQIIGEINSATQTRRMTKISKEHAM
ncbi:hypothetical protein Tco_0767806, partial [Tanacetum coccineum]